MARDPRDMLLRALSGTNASPNKLPTTDTPDPVLMRNQQWSQPSTGGYLTGLSPTDEVQFQMWRAQNGVPFDPSQSADYDMRGFWKDMTTGGGHAATGINANDGQMHFTDHFKTPYHESFSRESQWATPDAPTWNQQDQLIDRNGNVVFDERAMKMRGQ